MGEIADDIVSGDICDMCCTPFDDEGAGYPRRCAECRVEYDKARDAGYKYAQGRKARDV